jgi:hypothetical protein
LGTVGAPGKLPVIAAQLSIMLVTPQKARRGPGCGQISERCLFVHEIRFSVYRSEVVFVRGCIQEYRQRAKGLRIEQSNGPSRARHGY